MTDTARLPSSVWRTWIATFALAAGIALLQSLAIYRFKLSGDAAARLLDSLVGIGPPMLVLAIVSNVLALAFQRHAATLLRPGPMLACLAAILALALPLQAAVASLAGLWHEGLPWSSFIEQLHKREAFVWWVDTCMTVFAFLGQAAYAAWQRGRQQDRARQEAEDEGLELRLRLLQGQLKPHFLFNALNSISALVRTADRELAAHALAQLGALLRYAVHASRHEWLSTADEIAFMDDYLQLQLLRYGERLTVDVKVEDAPWARLACPPLLFQPLVENAIHHGVERHHDACRITIRLALEQDTIRLTVHNLVTGTEPARAGHGIGQTATRERLAILYGEAASLHAEAGAQGYTATLAYPARPFDDH